MGATMTKRTHAVADPDVGFDEMFSQAAERERELGGHEGPTRQTDEEIADWDRAQWAAMEERDGA